MGMEPAQRKTTMLAIQTKETKAVLTTDGAKVQVTVGTHAADVTDEYVVGDPPKEGKWGIFQRPAMGKAYWDGDVLVTWDKTLNSGTETEVRWKLCGAKLVETRKATLKDATGVYTRVYEKQKRMHTDAAK